ncbi:MAG: hypothetical protein AAF871_17415 [Pseudomonadota bacterium]
MRYFSLLTALALAACAPDVPQDTASGVGFGTPDEAGRAAPDPIITGTLSDDPFAISTETIGDDAPVTAARPTLNNPEISDEQDFDAVSGRETIESDAARLERIRQEYRVIDPKPVPTRTEDGGEANIVAFALETRHPVGQKVYSRFGSGPSEERFNRLCASYGSNDAAQRAFLEMGGPERDRRGLDPDGDGYACRWDPAPFRTARR